eukprot:gene12834-7184_t
MSTLTDTQQVIASSFNKAQKTSSCHNNCHETLRNLLSKDSDLFLDSFFQIMKPTLLHFKHELYVERVIQFIVKFAATSEEKPENFCCSLILKLLPLTNCKEKAVRFRTCQIISGIISELPDEAEVEDEFWNELIEVLLPRLKDKIPIVRMYAVSSLARLQDPSDEEDDILNEFFRLLSHDSNKDVRKTVLMNIEITKLTLPKILERTRDVKDDVRITAFETLLSKVAMKKLTISQRVKLLKEGLNDRNEKVKESCIKLSQTWLNQMEMDILKFLDCLDIEYNVEECELVLDCLFEVEKFKNVSVEIQNLNPSSVFFWRRKCDFLKKKNEEDLLDENLLSITKFCELLIYYQTENIQEFVVKELLKLSKHLDFGDEIGRRNIHKLLNEMLIAFTLPELYVKEIVQSLVIIVNSKDELTSTIIGAIDELRKAANEGAVKESTEEEKEIVETKLKKLNKQVKVLEKRKRKYVIDEEYEEAKSTKIEIQKMKEEIEYLEEELKLIENEESSMWMRALLIIHEYLNATKVNLSHMLYLKDDVVLKNINDDNSEIKSIAFSILGQFSSLKKEIAIENIDLFINSLNSTQDTIVHESILKSIFDILMIHKEIIENESNFNILSSLKNFFKSNIEELRTLICEGFCKLLLCKVLPDNEKMNIISTLMLIFNDTSIDNPKLKQCLNTFFPAFSFSYFDNLKFISDSFLSTIKKVYGNSDINLLHLSQYFIYLTDLKNLTQNEIDLQNVQIHETIAISIAFEILSDPKSKDSNNLIKLFPILSFNSLNQNILYQIYFLCPKIKKSISNKLTQKSFEKFEKNLKSNLELDKMDDKKQLENDIELKLQKYLKNDSLENEDEIIQKKRPKSKKSGAKKKVMRSKRKVYSDLEDEKEEEEFSDLESSPDIKRKKRQVTKQPKKKLRIEQEEIEDLLKSDSEQSNSIPITKSRESILKLKKD